GACHPTFGKEHRLNGVAVWQLGDDAFGLAGHVGKRIDGSHLMFSRKRCATLGIVVVRVHDMPRANEAPAHGRTHCTQPHHTHLCWTRCHYCAPPALSSFSTSAATFMASSAAGTPQ